MSNDTANKKILIIGGYGNFGKRLVESLLNHYQYDVVIAGRSKQKLIKAEHFFNISSNRNVSSVVLDIFSDNLIEKLKKIQPTILVNACGPYQKQAPDQKANEVYRVAEACLEANCHYIDLADDRDFVQYFAKSLNTKAESKNLTMVTGASSVPALTDAVIREYLSTFEVLNAIDYGIAPGNKTERGHGTVASILSYTGKIFSTQINGQEESIFGWQDIRRYDFGKPLGKRWLSNCDIPDLALLPKLYPQLKDIRFQAGLEVSCLHVGLWGLSWLSRFGLIKSWARYTKSFVKMSNWFINCGSNSGGMFVELSGTNQCGQVKKVNWQLIAENGVGPNVPTVAAEIIINKITTGSIKKGAFPCVQLFNLNEFLAICERWGIFTKERVSG